MPLLDYRHPTYDEVNWFRWRLAYHGGDDFVRCHLKKFSSREEECDFILRRCMTPATTFAKSAIGEIRNSIFQRLIEVCRRGGTPNYLPCCMGERGGVDGLGSSMMAFIGEKVLDELLVVSRIGVCVDAPEFTDMEIGLNTTDFKPYLSTYYADDIANYKYGKGSRRDKFEMLLLNERVQEFDEKFDFPVSGEGTRRQRLFQINEDGFVTHQYLFDGEEDGPQIVMGLREIPFTLIDIGQSLMKDIFSYQVALLNLTSSNVSAAYTGNFSLYVEQGEPNNTKSWLRDASTGNDTDGPADGGDTSIKVGATKGRRYPKGVNAPAFINPSAEPLLANMKLCQQLKDEMRQLVHLSITNLGTRTSAQSKAADQQGLESGLSYIGLILERAERQISRHWAAYENKDLLEKDQAVVVYPTRWNLKTDAAMIEEATETYTAMSKLPGQTVKKEAAKQLVNALLGSKVPSHVMDTIHSEIDNANYTTSDPKVIEMAREQGLLGDETGVQALGFSASEAKAAQDDHEAKIKRLQIAQTSPNGGTPNIPNGGQSSDDRQQQRQSESGAAGAQPVRGEGRESS